MSDSAEGRAASWWDALRRRKLVQWGLVYAAGAWGFLQGLEYVGESLNWPQQVRLDPATCIANGMGPLDLVFHGAANDTVFDVQFIGTNLIGTIVYASQSDFVDMTGGPIWTVADFSSDAGVGCICIGLTGRWVLDPSSIPEPASLALLGLGLAGLGVTRLRRQN